jgi:hypothetical protein
MALHLVLNALDKLANHSVCEKFEPAFDFRHISKYETEADVELSNTNLWFKKKQQKKKTTTTTTTQNPFWFSFQVP